MRLVKVHLRSKDCPYSQSRMHETPKLNKNEADDLYEERTWRNKCTTDQKGQVLIPAMAFKQALDRAAQVLSMKTGKGRNTFTKHFVAGCVCTANVGIGINKKDAGRVRLPCHTNGKRGSGSRVFRIFPVFEEWKGIAEFVIFDDTITQEVFEEHLRFAGDFVGIGRFRPENGGLNGKFECIKFDWIISGPTAEEAIEMENAEDEDLEAAE